jgi:hypothetical protein
VAIRWAVASGNWSSTATWNGGTLPAVDDDVFADGWNVTINQNITAISLNTTQRSGGTNGGEFVCTTNRTINANIIAGGNRCLNISTGTATIVVNGNVFAGATGFSGADGIILQSVGAVTLTINGNLFGGGSNNCNGLRMNNANHSVTVNGNAQAGTNATAYGINNTSIGSVTLNGIAIASNTAEAINNASTGTFTIAAARHAPNGRSPWTNNGKILFANLDLAHVTVNNAANVQRMLGRRMLAPLGSFEGGFNA